MLTLLKSTARGGGIHHVTADTPEELREEFIRFLDEMHTRILQEAERGKPDIHSKRIRTAQLESIAEWVHKLNINLVGSREHKIRVTVFENTVKMAVVLAASRHASYTGHHELEHLKGACTDATYELGIPHLSLLVYLSLNAWWNDTLEWADPDGSLQAAHPTVRP